MYIDKSLRSFSSAREKWGQKQKCCVYNFVQYVYVCVYIYIYATLNAMLNARPIVLNHNKNVNT